MLNDLAEILEIESLLSDPYEGAPFGKNLRASLDWFLSKAKAYGLKTGEHDGYAGYAEYGDGEEMIGILCHLDIVPAGKGWTYPPYKLTIADGILYGRGVVDNKGSAVIALHILKSLKENNVKLKRRIRLIVGLNEELGSACIKHYVKVGEIPKMSFVPDADFPVINSEKGILDLKVIIPVDDFIKQNILSLEAGTRANVIPDYAKVEIPLTPELEFSLKSLCGGQIDNSIFSNPLAATVISSLGLNPKDFSLELLSGKIALSARGIAGHAMAPTKADNAIHKLIALLNAIKPPYGGETISTVNTLFCSHQSAERLGIAYSDDKSGELTLSLGIIKYEGENIELTFNLRLPLCADKDDVIQKIKEHLPEGSEASVIKYSHNHYVDETSPLIKSLLKVYSEVTGNEPYTVQTGGGTYARELPNAVAFGPTFPNMVTNIHNIDEHISIKEFNLLYDIYYKAVLELCNKI